MKVEEVNPYNTGEEKGEQIERMFDSISRRYDLMNSAMSLGQHKRWSSKALKAALKELRPEGSVRVLDVACGTGEVAFRINKLLPSARITGIDLSDGMLDIAKEKLKKLALSQQELIVFGKCDCLSMPFHDGDFEMVTVAYGVRNFSDLKRGIQEIRRVLAPGGVLCLIELSMPTGWLPRQAYKLYSGLVIPQIGKLISGDKRAYSYLPESIAACPQREDMAALLYACGFSVVDWKSLSFGALTYYIAR